MMNSWHSFFTAPVQAYPLFFALLVLLSLALGAGLCLIFIYRRSLHWQRETAEQLENSIQSRTLELQFALNELADKNRILEQQNTTDALSGVRNRAYFDKKIVAELKRSRREQRPFALIMLDIDHFKQINDVHGHLAGDAVIRGVAQRISQLLKRSSDQICRYGGEEFALLLPNTDAAGAMALAEQIRQAIADAPFATEVTELGVHISAGCFAATASADSIAADYIQAADQALYQAKTAGRNQVKLAEHSETLAEEFPPSTEGQSDELIL